MKQYSFYGSSDDLFMVAIDGKDYEEIYPPEQYLLEHGEDRLVINAHYGIRAGLWSIGVEPWDEDEQMPDWPCFFRVAKNGYSSELVINTSDETTIRIINREE